MWLGVCPEEKGSGEFSYCCKRAIGGVGRDGDDGWGLHRWMSLHVSYRGQRTRQDWVYAVGLIAWVERKRGDYHEQAGLVYVGAGAAHVCHALLFVSTLDSGMQISQNQLISSIDGASIGKYLCGGVQSSEKRRRIDAIETHRAPSSHTTETRPGDRREPVKMLQTKHVRLATLIVSGNMFDSATGLISFFSCYVQFPTRFISCLPLVHSYMDGILPEKGADGVSHYLRVRKPSNLNSS